MWEEVLLGCFVVVIESFSWVFLFIVYCEYNFYYCTAKTNFFLLLDTLCIFFTSVHSCKD